MDWTPSEMQGAITGLAKQVLRSSASPWQDLNEAGLADVSDLLELVALLEQVGRTGARVPALETFVFGAPARRDDDPADIVLTGAPGARGLSVTGGVARGTVECVASGTTATRMVFATEAGLFSVTLADCAVEGQVGTNEDIQARVVLDGAPATMHGDAVAAAAWSLRCEVGICAVLFGLSREALIMTARYTSGREQFGRPIATFQAVSQRAADGWIQLNAMELTLIQAAWRVQRGMPADREVAIARVQAAEGSHRILATAQHLHGGHGFDRDYPLHRYFLTAKTWELVGGGASAQLSRLGGIIRSQAVSGPG